MPGFQLALRIISTVLIAIMAVGAVRIVRGPSLADRVVALDMVAYATVGVIATQAIYTEKGALLDVALVLSLLVFLGTVAFSRFLEKVTKS